MAGLNDLIRSSGGGSIAKPLLLGLGALLAMTVLHSAPVVAPAHGLAQSPTAGRRERSWWFLIFLVSS